MGYSYCVFWTCDPTIGYMKFRSPIILNLTLVGVAKSFTPLPEDPRSISHGLIAELASQPHLKV